MSPSTVNVPVPVHGNYHGYYAKRPSIKDPRLSLLSPGFFVGKSILDVGCNEGWVTCEIAQSWGAHKVVGVDIDDTLISAAWRRRRTVWSLQAPYDTTADAAAQEIHAPATSQKRQRELPEDGVDPIATGPIFFPMSCAHTFGPLPIPPSSSHVFPHHLSFRTADWTKTEIPEDKHGYDVVIAFSISKWIHLNGGDDALMTFFRRVHVVLKNGGTLVLEPQAWETYAKAKRMDEKLKENAKHLRLRPEDFEAILGTIGFSSVQHMGAAGEGGFRRPVDLYVKL